MGQIIACGNPKGGVGKTTIAVNLACELGARDRTVVVLDVDPQGGAAAWASAGRLPVRVEWQPPIDAHTGGRWPHRANALAAAHDVVVLDLPPLMVSILAAAMTIADLVLVPVTPSPLDVVPTEQTLRMARLTRESRAAHRPRGLLVPNRVDFRGYYHDAIIERLDGLPERWAPTLRHHTDHVSAAASGSWIGAYAPESVATADIIALGDAVEALLGGARPQPQRPDAAPERTRRTLKAGPARLVRPATAA